MRMNSNTILAGRGVNALAALDAGNRARAFQEDAQFQNALRPMQMESAQLGVQQQRQNLQLGQEQIANLRRQAAAAASAAQDKATLAREYEQAQNGMKMALTALTTGDEQAWNQVAAGFGMPGLPMDESGARALDAVLSGIGEGLGLGAAIPERVKPTDDMREYEMARSQGYQGTFTDYMTDLRRAGASTTSIRNEGTIPSGYRAIRDDQGNLIGYEPVPGGPEDTSKEDALAAEAKGTSANIVLDEIALAKGLIEGQSLTSPATGMMGEVAKRVPGSRADKLENRLETIKANIGFDKLQSMRDASPTGGALGQVSEFENRLLQAVYGSLLQSQDDQELVYNLERLEDIYKRIIHVGIPEREARRLYGEIVGGDDIAPASGDTGGIPEGVDPADWEFMTPEERRLFQ